MPLQWGGTGAIEAINIAAAARRTVFPHVFCPIDAHLACAFPNVESVERIQKNPERILCIGYSAMFPPREKGKMSSGSEPGIGISIDWEAVQKLSRRLVVIARRANPSPATDAGSNLLEPA